MVWVDHRFVGKGPVLRFANHHGPFHVPGLEDDAHDHDRPAAADDDEDHAGDHGRTVYDLPHLERPGGIYSYQQLGRYLAAVVAQPHAPGALSTRYPGPLPDAHEAATQSHT